MKSHINENNIGVGLLYYEKNLIPKSTKPFSNILSKQSFDFY